MKRLLTILLLSACAFAQTSRTSATKEGNNTYSGTNQFGTVLCTGSCILKMASLVDADGYVSNATLTSTPTVPDAAQSLTRAFRVKLTAAPSSNDATLDFTAGYFHTVSSGVKNMCCFNAAMGYAEHAGSGVLDAAYGQRGYAIVTGSGTLSKGVGLGGICQVTSASGIVTDCRAYELHVLAGPGTITTGYGAYIKTPYVTSGSIGTSYGIYLEDQNVGTTKYAIYTNAGVVRFGDVVRLKPFTFATLPTSTAANGDLLYCSDCTIASPTASGGTGALVKRLNGAWVGN